MRQFKPFHLLAVVAGLLIILTFFTGNQSMDIHLHDTYFVISINHLITALAVIFIFYGVLYRLTESFLLSRWLTWSHVICCILFTAGFCYFIWFRTPSENSPRIYHDFSNWESMRMFPNAEGNVVIAMAVLILLQLLFPLNMIAGAIRFWIRKSK